MNDKTVLSKDNKYNPDEIEEKGLPSWLRVSLIVVACAAIGILILYFRNFHGSWGNNQDTQDCQMKIP